MVCFTGYPYSLSQELFSQQLFAKFLKFVCKFFEKKYCYAIFRTNNLVSNGSDRETHCAWKQNIKFSLNIYL